MEESMRKRLDATLERFEEIDRELSSPEIAEDVAKLTSLSKERAGLEEAYNKYKEYLKYEQTSKDALELLETVNEADMVELAKEERKDALNNMERLEDEFKILLLPKDPNDDKNIIVEIRGAVGGDEANIFAGDLMRMYVKYAETQGWKIQLLDAALGASGGYSYVSFMVKGENVYSKLKFESGGHRVQRVPKTNDLKIDTYHSQGAGGQNVNKTESAVRITHIPTGLVVACQTEKAQLQNKEIAMQMIRAKVFAYFQEQEDAKRANEIKLKVGTGERSEKIRTYNYPQNRVTDHRIGFTTQKLDRVMEGDLDEIIDALIHFDQEQKMLEGKSNA